MCLFTKIAGAQATGRISGTVDDPAGNPLAGARVVLTSPGTHPYAWTTTFRGGQFDFAGLIPGVYGVTVEAANLGAQSFGSVHVEATVEKTLPAIRMAAHPAHPESAEHPAGTLTVAAVDQATGDQFNQLPALRRDPFQVISTLSGIQDNGRATAIYGQSPATTNITLDGIDIENSFGPPSSFGSTALPLHIDQVGEAVIATGAIYDCGCSQLMLRTPRPSEFLHGSAYWLGIPAGVTAQYWAANQAGTPGTSKLDQAGADLGGPLRKNQLFFFTNYEADLDRSTITRSGEVPTHPLVSADSLVQRVVDMIPSNPSGIYRGEQANGSTVNLGLLRLDWLASARNVFWLTLSGAANSMDDPADSSIFGPNPTTTIHTSARFFSAFWRTAMGRRAHLTNELRAGASLGMLDLRNSLRDQFGFIAILDDPGVSVSQPMSGRDPQGRSDNDYSFADTISWATGRHLLQFGAWIQEYRVNSYGFDRGLLDSLTVPRYVIADIAQGTISEIDQRFNILSPESGYLSGTTARSNLSANMLSGFFQDTWNPFRSFAISMGYLYDYLSPASERTGTAIVPSLASFAANLVYNPQLPFGFASAHQALYAHDLDNNSPYVGLAWKPFGLPVVARGSFNISYTPYDLLPNMSIYALENPFQSFNVSTPVSGIALSNAPATPAPSLPATLTLPSLLAFANSYHQEPGTVYAVSGDLRTPNVHYWNFGVGGRVSGIEWDVRYLGNRLEEGPRSVDFNQVMLPPAFLSTFLNVRSAIAAGIPTGGFPLLPGGGLCANFSAVNCQPDVHAISLIETGQVGELARWYQDQGYAPDGAAGYYVLGNPLAPGGIDLLAKLGHSRYDALQLTASKRGGNGIYATASYVYSKVMSNLDDYQQGAVDPQLDDHNMSLEWAPAPYNQKQAVKLAATWKIPLGSGHGPQRGAGGWFLRDWSVSGIAIAQSGAPFSLLSGGEVISPGGQVGMVTGLGTLVSQADSGENTVTTSLNATQIEAYFGIRENPDGTVSYVHAPAGAFAEPAPATLGNLQRRMFTSPGVFNLDLGLRKEIALTERARIEFRADSLNTLNNVAWLVGDQTFLGNAAGQAQFNNNVTQWNAPRTVQFALRLLF